MNEFQIAYHELEMMQELEMLEKGTNISAIADDYLESKKENEPKKQTSAFKTEKSENGGYVTEIITLD